MEKSYVIREYGGFVKESINKNVNEKYTKIPDKTFDLLEELVIKKDIDEDGAAGLMQISSVRGIGKVICGRNYVGIIELTDGTTIEILPKIYLKDVYNDEIQLQKETRKIFLTMLKTLKDIPFKEFNMTSIGAVKNNLYEIFIGMYINEVFKLIKTGLKSDYINYEANENFLKGKIVFNDHIKNNFIHKERFYVNYDIFNVNRPENKLIKSTIFKLLSKTNSKKNEKNLKHLIILFDEVDKSINYQSDFSKVKYNRDMKNYEIILQWSRIFLVDYTFAPFKGEEKALSLLFPMERVFEDYVASLIRKQMNGTSWTIKVQEKKYHLFNRPSNKFLIKPDIVMKSGHRTIILDTKWKVLNPDYSNYGISQSDMYQMYAYGKKYSAEKVILIYPYNEYLNKVNFPISFESDDRVEVQIYYIDLYNSKASIENLLKKIIGLKAANENK